MVSKRYASFILSCLDSPYIYAILKAEDKALKGHNIKNPTNESKWIFEAVRSISKLAMFINHYETTDETVDIIVKTFANRFPSFAIDKMFEFLTFYSWNAKDQSSRNLAGYLISKLHQFARIS